MATCSSVLAWRIPGTGKPGGLPSMGSHRVGHDWSDLAAAATEDYVYTLWFSNFRCRCMCIWKYVQEYSQEHHFNSKLLEITQILSIAYVNQMQFIKRHLIQMLKWMSYIYLDKFQNHNVVIKNIKLQNKHNATVYSFFKGTQQYFKLLMNIYFVNL